MKERLYFFGAGSADGDGSLRELLGGKGAGLAEMTKLGVPVPPGFTLPTSLCLEFFKSGDEKSGNTLDESLKNDCRAALKRVGELVDAGFGDPERPLLLSVRSGARVSMPGMMDTILNLGLNEKLAESLGKRTNNRRFALDAYRRFITMYSDVVLDLPRERFDSALEDARRKTAAELNIEASRMNVEELRRAVPDSKLTAESLSELCAQYRALVLELWGKPFPEDPHDQLWGAIMAVFRSWYSHRAKVYRGMYDIPESWGTACTVQAMVFGNLGDDSGTGVGFTRDPSTGENRFYGEWLPNAQGEDVVAGIRTPMSITSASAEDTTSLESQMPVVYKALTDVFSKLEKHFRDMQDIEFTIQSGKLFLLQCRTGKRTARAAVRIAVEMVQAGDITTDEAILRVNPSSIDQLLHPSIDPSADNPVLAKGLPASPGAVSGIVVFTADDAERRAGQGKDVILVRTETSPEDIHGMKAARGILTSRGGMTSHAAVVARGMGKSCVAGCSAVGVSYEQETMSITLYDEDGAPKGEETVKVGEVITLDGASGTVFRGAVPTVPAALTDEFGKLMEWADAARKLRVRANADTPHDARTARNFGAEGIGLCRTEHMFFDDERILAMREMILSSDKDARKAALAKLLPFQREDFVGVFREMAGFPVTIRLLDPPLHEFLPHDRAQLQQLAEIIGTSIDALERKNEELAEYNPMLGHRGCRLAITYPEIYEMQVRAILEAACEVSKEGVEVDPEIMIPLAMTAGELEVIHKRVNAVAEAVFAEKKHKVAFKYGSMIELPRAALTADQLAAHAEFFSFGTNDLTQTALGLSRDDAGRFLGAYVEAGLLAKDPFQTIDRDGVGELVKIAAEKARAARPGVKLGICGEHGGDPASVVFFASLGLDYVSCSPFRVPIARLALAHAALAKADGSTGSDND